MEEKYSSSCVCFRPISSSLSLVHLDASLCLQGKNLYICVCLYEQYPDRRGNLADVTQFLIFELTYFL